MNRSSLAVAAAAVAACLALPAPASAELTLVPAPGGPHELVAEELGDVVTGDLNGDGRTDLAVADALVDVEIYFGRADGGFDYGGHARTDVGTEQVVVANLDQDTDLDMVAAGDRIQPLLNDGTGTFTLGTVVNTGAGPEEELARGMVAANFDGDGDIDVAVSMSDQKEPIDTSLVRILGNDGSGNLTVASNEPAGGFAGALVKGNFDGAGGIDLAYEGSTGGADRIKTLLHAGGLDFTPGSASIPIPFSPGPLQAGQLDGTGLDDLAFFGSVSVAFGTGNGGFGAPVKVSDIQPWDLAVGDITNDDIPDLVVVDDTTIRVFAGNGSGGFALAATLKFVDKEWSIHAVTGDFDADEADDVAVIGEKTLYTFLTRGAPARPGKDGGGGGATTTPTGPAGPVPAEPATTPPPIAAPARTLVRPPRLDVLSRLPSNRRCVSRRAFRIRLPQAPPGVKVKQAEVRVNGKRVRLVRAARLRAPVDLRGLPKGRATVEIRIVLADGTVVRGSRRYRTCAPKRKRG